MKQLWISLKAMVVFTLLLGIAYPLAMTAIAQIVFPAQANGSVITVGGKVVGSALIGQMFTSPRYFHGRPSANAYDASNSGGTNFALTNKKLIDQIRQNIDQVRKENGLAPEVPVPADLVTASASGLDPDISVAGAMLQVKRVAAARKLPDNAVIHAVEQNTEPPFLGIFGAPVVNVLRLNVALDTMHP